MNLGGRNLQGLAVRTRGPRTTVAVPGAQTGHSWFKLVPHGRTLRLCPGFGFPLALCRKQHHNEHLGKYLLTFWEVLGSSQPGTVLLPGDAGGVWGRLSLSCLGATGFEWRGAGTAAQHPTGPGRPCPPRTTRAQESAAPRIPNPASERVPAVRKLAESARGFGLDGFCQQLLEEARSRVLLSLFLCPCRAVSSLLAFSQARPVF